MIRFLSWPGKIAGVVPAMTSLAIKLWFCRLHYESDAHDARRRPAFARFEGSLSISDSICSRQARDFQKSGLAGCTER
jgi:hypothetical protein